MGKIVKAAIVITAVALLIIAGQPQFALTFIGKMFVAVGVSIVVDAFAPKPDFAAIRQRGLKVEFQSPVAPRTIAYGTTRLAGTRIAAFTSGTDNKFLHIFFALASHECEGVTKYFANDEAFTVDGNGLSTSGKYSGKIRVIIGLGTAGQTADGTLVSEITQWTTNHRLRGICYMAVRFEYDREVFTQGRPTVSVVLQGAKVFDTRISSTAFSNNWALVNYDYLTIGGGSAFNLGCRIPTTEILTSAVDTAANESDENVSLKAGGTQKRYTADGVVQSTAPRKVNYDDSLLI